jgi:hypothetical protein
VADLFTFLFIELPYVLLFLKGIVIPLFTFLFFVCWKFLEVGFRMAYISPFISPLPVVLPQVSVDQKRFIVIAAALTLSVTDYFSNVDYISLFVTIFFAMGILQIFNVAKKRRNVEKFAKHSNASICLAKCLYLVVLNVLLSMCFPGLLQFVITYIFYIGLIFRGVPFKIVNYISDNSWRSLINVFSNLYRK